MTSPFYVSDLDGTLLRSDATLSEFSRNTLRGLLEDGLQFTVASARSVVSMQTMLHGLRLELPIIEFNGAFISDLETGRHQIINSIERELVENIYGIIQSFGCVPFVSSFNGTEDCLYYCDIINDGMQWYHSSRLQLGDRRLRSIANLTHSFADEVVCLTIIGYAGALRELQTAIDELHAANVEMHLIENQYSPGWYWLTIHDFRASKDQALRSIQQEFGLQNRELVVFGDQNNDLKMFQVADRAVALANATADLKHHATQVIGTNDEDSVTRFISEDWTKYINNVNRIFAITSESN